MLWIELALRAPDQLTTETHRILRQTLRALKLASKEAGYMDWIKENGSNGANIHGYLTPLTLAPALIKEPAVQAAGEQAVRAELAHLNTTGDMVEFNLLESHWNGTSSWELIKQYAPDPHLRRMARLISERLWINRFLTWSPAVERITGPGSRMAPSEWLGTDNERALFATGLSRPVWLNFFFRWDGWDSRALRQTWEQTQLEATVPDLPVYLQDLAWRKTFPNELQTRVALKHWKPYPPLAGVSPGAVERPAKYVNYQTDNYTLGSTTSSWVVNTCVVAASAWWNNSRNPKSPVGSPERFCVLYPHYVFNGMSFLDKGDLFFQKDPNHPVKDSKGGSGGPWLREFIDFGRVGTLQDRNTLLLSYTAKPGTHHPGEDFVKTTIQRASAAMFLFRWTDGTDGLYVNREPVRSLPYELKPGDWWFIEDGEVYAAVRPLKATSLKGNGRTVLEKRTRHIVLYQDNVAADDINGISDEAWVKAQSGFIVEMGNRQEYGSFATFQNRILSGQVTKDSTNGFNRHLAYQRDDRRLEMDWHCYTEEYARRQIGGREDGWPRFAQAPEFAASNQGSIKVHDAVAESSAGNTLWLLACSPSKHWIAYQTQPDRAVPLRLDCPAGRFESDHFPFGKVVLHQPLPGIVNVAIDASYRFKDKTELSPFELYLDSRVTKVNVTMNGINFRPRQIRRDGKVFWQIKPGERLRELKIAAQPRPVVTR